MSVENESGIVVESGAVAVADAPEGVAAETQAEDATETQREVDDVSTPVGFEEMVAWYVENARVNGKDNTVTIRDLYRSYPGVQIDKDGKHVSGIKFTSFQAKISKLRTDYREYAEAAKAAGQKIGKLPKLKKARGGRGKNEIDIVALSNRLGLNALLDAEDDDDDDSDLQEQE